MRRVATALGIVLVLFLSGAAAWFKPWEPRVWLLAGEPAGYGGPGCFTNHAAGPLVIHPTFGTAIIDSEGHATIPVPVMWRPGYTARQAGSEVEVLGPIGNVVATTGRNYMIEGGYVDGIFWACGFVDPQ